MSGDQLEEAEVDRLGAAVFEQRRLAHMLRQRGAEIEALRAERERLAGKAHRALGREEDLRQGLRDLDQKATALGEERDRIAAELKQARYEQRRAERRSAQAARDIEKSALELGRAKREVELLAGLEKEREAVLADSDRKLGEVAEHLRRVRASRSWRWGHATSQALRALTFRRHSGRSALDTALERLGAADPEGAGAQDEPPGS